MVPMLEGMDPLIGFPPKLKKLSFFKLPTLEGMDPVSLLVLKSRCTRFFKLPMVGEMGPVRFCISLKSSTSSSRSVKSELPKGPVK